MPSYYGLEKRNAPELELVIAGAGAAGLSAAIYSSLMDINYVLLDAESGGGLMNLAKTVENFPGVVGKRGPEITEGLTKQLKRVGGKLNAFEPAEEFDFSSQGILKVKTGANVYFPKTLIISTGLELLGLKEDFGIEGERNYLGKGVSYCAECDGPLFKGKRVIVIGNPFEAFLLKRLCDITSDSANIAQVVETLALALDWKDSFAISSRGICISLAICCKNIPVPEAHLSWVAQSLTSPCSFSLITVLLSAPISITIRTEGRR